MWRLELRLDYRGMLRWRLPVSDAGLLVPHSMQRPPGLSEWAIMLCYDAPDGGLLQRAVRRRFNRPQLGHGDEHRMPDRRGLPRRESQLPALRGRWVRVLALLPIVMRLGAAGIQAHACRVCHSMASTAVG